MRVLVCGGRDYRDWPAFLAALDAAHAEQEIEAVIHGCAKGADDMAATWASIEVGITELRFPANWKAHGRAAGPLRNQRMLDEGKPDLVLAFPGGRGTADMVRRAEAAGVPVPKPEKPRKGPTAFDYPSWVLNLAAYLSEPRGIDDLAERYGLSTSGLKVRLCRARQRGCWPPAGMSARWVRSGADAQQLALEPTG